MDNIAFYRKYRPKKFSEVLGQEHIVKALSGAVGEGRIFHAYLFTGPRGTGKTSMARILAKEIGATEKDIYELDAASNTSVEDIREITEGARTMPFESPKKVYIIDEVHMLSKSAFNAFLKTLEEPPAHAVFILATTEAHKLPQTVVSRCQSFSFKKPSKETLKKALGNIAKKEKYEIDKEAVELIAELGDGSFRDAIGILEQVANCSAKNKISIADVEAITGAPRGALIHALVGAIIEKNISFALKILKEIVGMNVDIKIFIRLLLRDVRNLMLMKLAPDLGKEIKEEISEEELNLFEKFKNHQNIMILPEVLREIILAGEEVGRSQVPELPLELALVRLLGQNV